MKQRTIKKPVSVVGVGLHSGVAVSMRLEPLGCNEGIVFFRKDKNVSIPLKIENVVNTKMATVIGKGDVTISTIEHLLSATFAYGIDNLRVVLDNYEIPIMDSSSTAFCLLIDEAGIKKQEESKKVLVIKKEITVKDGDKFVTLKPSNKIAYDFKIDFDHPIIGIQKYHFEYSLGEYKKNISRARTFGFLHELAYLKSIGLAKGASLDNAIGLDEKSVLNPDGLRFDNEFVRHKILDAIGDMALVGYTIVGEYSSFSGGHHLNHLITKELFSNKENYEIVELEKAKEEQKVMAYAYVQNK
jgi:UDP-3-O-[3-hydroxymyristoyl] N-acetylglucosamine deacetylase